MLGLFRGKPKPRPNRQKSGLKLPNHAYFLGTKLDITVTTSPLIRRKGFVERIENQLIITLPDNLEPDQATETAISALTIWFRQRAEKKLNYRSVIWSNQIGVEFKRIFIRAQKTRWGSCDQDNNIRYNWHIIACPPPLIDYLVVHELCHVIHKHHQPPYWALVAEHFPDFKRQRKALRYDSDIYTLPLRKLCGQA